MLLFVYRNLLTSTSCKSYNGPVKKIECVIYTIRNVLLNLTDQNICACLGLVEFAVVAFDG